MRCEIPSMHKRYTEARTNCCLKPRDKPFDLLFPIPLRSSLVDVAGPGCAAKRQSHEHSSAPEQAEPKYPVHKTLLTMSGG